MSVRWDAKANGVTLEPARVTGILQRKCDCGNHTIAGGECRDCEKKQSTLQRSTRNTELENHNSAGVPAIVHDVLSSSGQPLEPAVRDLLEPRFSEDFSRVRVHTDARAAESAQAVNALAYTVGNDIVFSAETYAPFTTSGKKLLAHELTHVTQQSGGRTQVSRAALTIGNQRSSFEREADEMSARVISGDTIDRTEFSRSPRRLSRQQAPTGSSEPSDGAPGCTIAPGIPNSICSIYAANSSWLPLAYVNNATCACLETPNVPTAKCVRKFLQDRLAATPASVIRGAILAKPWELLNPTAYQAYVQLALTPRIYKDHVDAYGACCCTSGPAPYAAWVGVTSVPLPCSAVGASIRFFGSCHGTPGTW